MSDDTQQILPVHAEQDEKTRPMTTAEIKAAMIAHYAAPEWALLFEVGNCTGSGLRTWADAVAMNLWPSRGLEVYGFEFKASRSDWKRELATPKKAEPVAHYCDRWFIVAADGVILDENEVPAGWGYIRARAGKLRTIKAAPLRDGVEIDRGFLAACLRRASEADMKVVAMQADKAYKAGYEDGKRIARDGESRAARDLKALRESIAEFERVSGVHINTYNGGNVGKVFAVAQALTQNGYGGVDHLVDAAERAVAKLREAMAALRAGVGA